MTVLFNDALPNHPQSHQTLPLTHATRANRVETILGEGELAIRWCPELQAELVYLFYGRPDYAPKDADNFHSDAAEAPFYLVLAPYVIAAAANIFPFDTGGYRLYQPHLAACPRDAFALAIAADSPSRVVEYFYESNADYFGYWPSDGLDVSAGPDTMRAYYDLITDPTDLKDDGRRSAIEISVAQPVPLKGALKLVIGPEEVLNRPAVKAALERLGCESETFQTSHRFSWRGFRETIRGILAAYYEKQGLM